jgi:DNA invertase Pin-like site-specific DNA recombinase
MVKVAYLRQTQYGPPLDEQQAAIDPEFIEERLIWKDKDKPTMRDHMLKSLRTGEDSLYVYGLDRLAVSTGPELMGIVTKLFQRGIEIKDTKAGEMLDTPLRTVEALHRAITQMGREKMAGINLKRRKDGRRPGKKPVLTDKDIPRVAEIYHNIGFYPTAADAARVLDVSESTYWRFIKRHNVAIERRKPKAKE